MLVGVDHLVIGVGERGPVGQWVDSRGPGPYAARFTGGALGAALDPRLSHGALLSFV
jgi:hypothetical protein